MNKEIIVTVEIHPGYVQPNIIEIPAGGGVQWRNQTDEARVIHLRGMAIGPIEAGATSQPIYFHDDLDRFGIGFQTDGSRPAAGTIQVGASHEPESGKVRSSKESPAGQEDAPEFTEEDWILMGQRAAAYWVYDLAEDFKLRLPVLATWTGEENVRRYERIRDGFVAIEAKWKADTGAPGLLSRAHLEGAGRDDLVTVGRALRLISLKNKLLARPKPDQGNSNLPFGRAIRVRSGSDVQEAYQREMAYAFTAWEIEWNRDDNNAVSEEKYEKARAELTTEDLSTLARFLEEGTRSFLGGSIVDNAEKFSDGIFEMTSGGWWTDSKFSLWHWLRFCQAYVEFRGRAGRVPDLRDYM